MYRVWEKGQRVLLEVFSDTTLQDIASSRVSAGFPQMLPETVAAPDK
jgi:hypothetical protein